jgi:hypothetical protein
VRSSFPQSAHVPRGYFFDDTSVSSNTTRSSIQPVV